MELQIEKRTRMEAISVRFCHEHHLDQTVRRDLQYMLEAKGRRSDRSIQGEDSFSMDALKRGRWKTSEELCVAWSHNMGSVELGLAKSSPYVLMQRPPGWLTGASGHAFYANILADAYSLRSERDPTKTDAPNLHTPRTRFLYWYSQ